MNELPAGVRWGLVLMGALLLSQSVGVHWGGKAPLSGYGTSETLSLMLYSDRDDGAL